MVEVASDEGEGPPGLNCVQKAYQALKAREDKQYGGFGSAPKFPQPGTISIGLQKLRGAIQ